MANDVLRLKNDVLNELRNQKYYAQDELKMVVDDTSMSQREKVAAIIEVAGEMVTLESKITLVDAIFIDNAPQTPQAPPLTEEPQGDDSAPSNIVEAPVDEPVAELNAQGQTHGE